MGKTSVEQRCLEGNLKEVKAYEGVWYQNGDKHILFAITYSTDDCGKSAIGSPISHPKWDMAVYGRYRKAGGGRRGEARELRL